MAIESLVKQTERELNRIDKEISDTVGNLLEERKKLLAALEVFGVDTAPYETAIRGSDEEPAYTRARTRSQEDRPESLGEQQRIRTAPKHRYPTDTLEITILNVMMDLNGDEWATAAGLADKFTKAFDGGDLEYWDYWRSAAGRIMKSLHDAGRAERKSSAIRGSLFAYRLNEKGLEYAINRIEKALSRDLILVEKLREKSPSTTVQKPRATQSTTEEKKRPGLSRRRQMEQFIENLSPQDEFTMTQVTKELELIPGGDVSRLFKEFRETGFIKQVRVVKTPMGTDIIFYRKGADPNSKLHVGEGPIRPSK